jgi:hypothetical protein
MADEQQGKGQRRGSPGGGEKGDPQVVEGQAGAQQEQARQGGGQGGGQGAQATGRAVEEAARQGDELRDTSREVARATAEAQAAAGPQEQGGSDDEHPLVVGSDLTPLDGVPTFLEVIAGSEAVYEALIAGDPYGLVDNPGAHLADGTIAHGTPVPAVEGAYREARARLGIPEPIKVDPSGGTTLVDTPGGQQMVPAGWSPDELAAESGHRQFVRGVPTSFPAGEEAGATVRHVGGRPLDEKGQDHPEA